MVQSVFGAGYLFGVPSGANPTPVMFGAVQDTSVDFSFDLKQLYGQNQFALEQARGKGKIDIKSSIGRFDPNLFNQIKELSARELDELKHGVRNIRQALELRPRAKPKVATTG